MPIPGFGAARHRTALRFDEMLAVMFELVDRFIDVGKRFVAAFLDEAFIYFGLPAQGKLFKGADIQITIMEKRLESGHIPDHETPILADSIAAQRRLEIGRASCRERVCQDV